MQRWTEAQSAERAEMSKRRRNNKEKRIEGVSWMGSDGVHAVMPGPAPSVEQLDEMTQEYQAQIRMSPLWEEIVKAYGEAQAKEILKGFRVELR
jgi:hypothetical protein